MRLQHRGQRPNGVFTIIHGRKSVLLRAGLTEQMITMPDTWLTDPEMNLRMGRFLQSSADPMDERNSGSQFASLATLKMDTRRSST
ncbi:hypothetical protein PO124_05550 [Bacillus licheniformis]|nr:hypothetical protein [Bacillus licheniformis]